MPSLQLGRPRRPRPESDERLGWQTARLQAWPSCRGLTGSVSENLSSRLRVTSEPSSQKPGTAAGSAMAKCRPRRAAEPFGCGSRALSVAAIGLCEDETLPAKAAHPRTPSRPNAR